MCENTFDSITARLLKRNQVFREQVYMHLRKLAVLEMHVYMQAADE